MTNMGCTNTKALPHGTGANCSKDCVFKANCKGKSVFQFNYLIIDVYTFLLYFRVKLYHFILMKLPLLNLIHVVSHLLSVIIDHTQHSLTRKPTKGHFYINAQLHYQACLFSAFSLSFAYDF